MTEPLTLQNCDREPIHVPGSIQPHGALLAFDLQGRLTHASTNTGPLLGLADPLPFGRALEPTELDGHEAAHALIRKVLDEAAQALGEDIPPVSIEARIAGTLFDMVVHATGGQVVCEFERRSTADGIDGMAGFAHVAYRSMDRIKRQRTVPRLLEAAVTEVRALTGFDRVMAYRFRHDDSGEVLAESCRDDLDPYLGRRYPASDIPAQARRLYTLNTLRLIADMAYTPVQLRAVDERPLDMSHGILRSVSPIHVEYLQNMGVAASMSISIVVAGKLWGMLACHHMSPRQVPYALRMASDVIAQLLASTVQSLAAQSREAAMAQASRLCTELLAEVAQRDGVVQPLQERADALAECLGCDALVVSMDGRFRTHGPVDPGWTQALLAWLGRSDMPAVVNRSTLEGISLPAVEGGAPVYCGLLGLRFDSAQQGWILGLRREQIETIRWGGKPDKQIAHGPLGPRLTPRGSFDEWRETVRGAAEPWDATELEIATLLLDTVGRAHADRVFELDRLRSQLWAVLGHDLRNPMQSLSMAAHGLGRGIAPDRMSSVIQNSAGRMQRLIGDVLDISRLQNGLGLGLHTEAEVDLVPLIGQLVEEVQVAYPGTVIGARLPAQLVATVDPGRFAQVIANLLSNARHHGVPGTIALEARLDLDQAVIEVVNGAEPIPVEMLATLFDPFKRQSLGNERNRTGMGLGLYIAHQVVCGHHGSLSYRPGPGTVSFEVRIPLQPPPATPAVD